MNKMAFNNSMQETPTLTKKSEIYDEIMKKGTIETTESVFDGEEGMK